MTRFAASSGIIRTPQDFERMYQYKVQTLLDTEPRHRGAAHAMKDDTTASTHELLYMTEVISVSADILMWKELVSPNLPWAEDHFGERVGGEPLNPSPSEAWWPFARQGNAEHKVHDEKFSHTYPERFWAYDAWLQEHPIEEYKGTKMGIRFPYGDLEDLVDVLKKNPMSRQAYLPIWFPEDLHAAVEGKRVPCSMGYHFLHNGRLLDCVYTMRSCDIVRFYRDDVYMAGRLLQWVGRTVGLPIGNLVLHIDNLHCFPGDRAFLESQLPHDEVKLDKRSTYNFGALG